MKKFFAGSALALLGLVALLQWTGRPADRHGVVQLIWATDDNPIRQEQMALFRTWYQKNYNQPIDIRIDPANAGQAKIIVQSVAGAGPDLFDTNGRGDLQAFVESGIVYDITAAAREGNFGPARFWPVLRDEFIFAGRQYAVPDNCNSFLILINEDMLEEKGLQLPKPGWKWEDLLTLAQALTVRDADGNVIRYGLLSMNWQDLVIENDGTFFNAAGTRCIFNSPQSAEALQFYHDLKFKYHVMPSAADLGSMATQGGYGAGDKLTLFTGGKGAMIDFGRYGYIAIRQENLEREKAGERPLRAVPLPPLSQHNSNLIAFARCTAINRRSDHLTEAVRFLQFLASREFNDQINRASDGLSTIPQDIKTPSGIDISGGRPALPGCDSPLWVSALQQGVPSPGSIFLSSAAFTQILREETSRLDNNLQSPAETAARIQDRINQAIATYISVRPALKRQWQALEALPVPSTP